MKKSKKRGPAARAQGRANSTPPGSRRRSATIGVAAAIVVAVGGAALGFRLLSSDALAGGDVTVPALSATAEEGRVAYDIHCARCHGASGSGSDSGPPLIHKIYEPSHHGDESFRRAARMGVRAHHWNFGAMPPINVPERSLEHIISYVRELQRANGIR